MELPIGFGVEGYHPRSWVIRLDKNLYDLKDSGLTLFEKLKEGLEATGFVKSQVDPCVCYKEEMVILFYVDHCLMFSPYKDKSNDIYASLWGYFQIEDDGELKNILE